MQSTLDFFPRPARKEMNVPLCASEKLKANTVLTYTVTINIVISSMPSEDRSKAVFSKYGPKFVKIPSFKILANLQTKMVANQMAVDSHLKVLLFGLKFIFL